MKFLVSGAMFIWDLDNVVAEEIVNLLAIQWAGNISWSNWSTLLTLGILLDFMILALNYAPLLAPRSGSSWPSFAAIRFTEMEK